MPRQAAAKTTHAAAVSVDDDVHIISIGDSTIQGQVTVDSRAVVDGGTAVYNQGPIQGSHTRHIQGTAHGRSIGHSGTVERSQTRTRQGRQTSIASHIQGAGNRQVRTCIQQSRPSIRRNLNGIRPVIDRLSKCNTLNHRSN